MWLLLFNNELLTAVVVVVVVALRLLLLLLLFLVELSAALYKPVLPVAGTNDSAEVPAVVVGVTRQCQRCFKMLIRSFMPCKIDWITPVESLVTGGVK